MQVKPTLYNGYLFRSKLEAKWAVFFDALKVPYIYEPDAFVCKDGSQYTPDFFLPQSYLRTDDVAGIYIEIKPAGWDRNENYLIRIASAFNKGLYQGDALLLFVGDPMDVVCDADFRREHRDIPNEQLSPGWDNEMILVFCEDCEVLKAEFSEGSYMYCPVCGKHRDLEKIYSAAEYARQFRFEYLHDKKPV